MLQSCTSEKSQDNSNSTILLKKIAVSGASINFTYDGDKLSKIVYPAGDYAYFKITYTGDFITRSEGFDKNNQPSNHNIFIYANNKLTQVDVYSSPTTLEETYNYIYNIDGSITKKSNNSSSVYFFDNNGNISKVKNYYNNSLQSTYDYNYDAKNNPFKNVIGYNPLLFGPNLMIWSMSTNNVTKQTITGSGSTNFDNSYQYNSQDYPISCSSTSLGQTTVATYFY
ncbi:hypothetical protein D3C80_1262920 [compost metagenome]